LGIALEEKKIGKALQDLVHITSNPEAAASLRYPLPRNTNSSIKPLGFQVPETMKYLTKRKREE
jgi:hypothetical protein